MADLAAPAAPGRFALTDMAAYRAHRRFIAAAACYRATWRILVVALGFEVAFAATPVLTGGLGEWIGTPASAAGTVFDLLTFVVPALVVVALVRLLHRRGLRSLVGPWPRFWRDLVRVAIAVAVLLSLREMLLLTLEAERSRQMPTVIWLLWLIPGIFALLVQTGTEELFYRGYLQQQFAVISARRVVWMGGPSILFGLAHLTNTADASDAALWAIWAGFLGFACADLTARTGTIGAAVGLHLANNIFALVIIGEAAAPGTGLSLFSFQPMPFETIINPDHQAGWWMFVIDVIVSATGVAIMWAVARLGLRWHPRQRFPK